MTKTFFYSSLIKEKSQHYLEPSEGNGFGPEEDYNVEYVSTTIDGEHHLYLFIRTRSINDDDSFTFSNPSERTQFEAKP